MILVPANNIEDKVTWKFTFDSEFSVKTATRANNISVRPHAQARILNNIWKLNFIPKVKLFASKPVRNTLLTRNMIRQLGRDITGDFPFCNKGEETINHIFIKSV